MWWSGPLLGDQPEMVNAIDAVCDRFAPESECKRWDSEKAYPREAMNALAASGWAALPVPRPYGEQASARDLVVVHQALGRRSLTLAQSYYSLWVLGADALARLGTEEQKARWLPAISSGSALVAFALTEPGSGSDAAALGTRAVQDGGDYLVNGQKTFITGALESDVIVTAVRTRPGHRRHDGLSLLMIDPSADGVTIHPLDKIGLRGLSLCEVFLDDVRVPATDVLGRPDDAWPQLAAGLARERLYLAAISVGSLTDLIGQVLEYAATRQTFGKPIGAHQMIAEKIVSMRVAADAGAGLVTAAADMIDAEDPAAAAAASVAKLFATDAYVSATREAMQIFGANGFTTEYPVSRHYRDCKYLEIGGGTSQIQTIVIGRSMGLPL
jgi:alkylation response protein AidB-like acyl-CoA dehydrogenase